MKTLPDVLSRLGASKAFIITGTSLKEKTPVVKDVVAALGSAHVGTYSGIRQHSYVSFDSICCTGGGTGLIGLLVGVF